MVECGGPGLVPGVGSCAKLPHSLSAGEVSRGHNSSNPLPPPNISNSTKMLAIRVRMLDDNVTLFQVQAKALGKVLFEQVCKQLNLLEADYFGLEYQDDSGIKYWLDLEKCLQRQVGLSLVEPLLQFCVKFYPADPTQLEEEYTRYLFCLQVKRDLAQGHMQCNDNTAALMASYIVQAECGDFVAEDYPDASYLSTYKFVQHQDKELERKIMENHKKHVGQSPAEADLNLLETARRCELYGVKMHPAKDHEGAALNLAVAHMGILVFINYNKINSFSWAKIRKISFKRKKFLIKLHTEGYGYPKDAVEFFFDTRNECKNLWKKCVEHHGFFRCSSVKRMPRQRARVLSRGSSFRYSGRTQKQIVEYVRENYVKRQTFQRSSPLSRSQSFRQSSSVHSSVANVGGSISAHPLIPLANASIVSICGSMAEDSQNQICHANQTTVSHSIQPLHHQSLATTLPLHTVAIVEKSSTRSSSPDIMSNGPLSNIENNNSIVVGAVSPSPKMNGGYISSEYASPDLSPMKSIKEKSFERVDSSDTEVKKKRYSNDRAYFIAKEFLMTERTYRKDLEVINLCVRDELGKEEWDCIKHLLSIIDPLHDEHCHLLKEVELRLAAWESRGSNHHRLADLLLAATHLLPLYEDFLQQHQTVLIELNKELTNETFREAYSNFEKIKLCYLPITRFILKPIQRLLHYEHLVDSLLQHYGKDHPDYDVCEMAKIKLEEVTNHIPDILRESENYIHLIELSRDISGFEGDLTEGDRQFIRQGSLAKFSQRKGYQQRMFFLFSDIVLYSNLKGQTFRLHGQMSLKNLTVQERVDNPSPNSFIIYTGNRALTVSANSQQEKDKWLEDLSMAIELSRMDIELNKDNSLPSASSLHSLKCSNSMEDVVDNSQDNQRATPQRSNTTVHVCWHRNTSICLNDLIRAAENQLSGYLLRKFKNSNGWQKLWVVFTNFCLFFYKTFQDEAPLASLPLLGYSVTTPVQEDGINKDFVFKLQFKNHIYFFRAESEYTFGRWMNVIGSATQHSGRLRIFSRKESDIQNNI